jgi:hypothetical protein
MHGLTPEQIWQYGAVIFTFLAAGLLLREFIIIFKTRLNDTWTNSETNKNCLEVISRNLKDMAVIQAQTLARSEKHEIINANMWEKLLTGFDRVCSFLNGKNPAIAKIREEFQAEIKKLRDKMTGD